MLLKYFLKFFINLKKNNFCHRVTEDFISHFLGIDNGKSIATILGETKLPQILIKGYNNIVKQEKETNYRLQYSPYLMNMAEIIERSSQHEEVSQLLDKIEDWNDLSKVLEQRNQDLSEFQNSFKVETTNVVSEYDEDLEIGEREEKDFPDIAERDDRDYDIENAEVLLTKIEIEAKN